jgi:hypothetical protein
MNPSIWIVEQQSDQVVMQLLSLLSALALSYLPSNQLAASEHG